MNARFGYNGQKHFGATMKTYDYILFDLDGTVSDSKPGIITCIKYALDGKGIKHPPAEIFDKMVGPPFRVSMKEFLGLDMPMIEQLITLYRGKYEVDGWRDCRLYDGMTDVFAALKSAGKKLAIATSKPLKFTHLMIEGLGLSQYFDFVGGASCDASAETKADVIELVLKNLKAEDRSRVLMLGDRLYDIEGAHACGLDCGAVMWGYGNLEEFKEYGADYILDTPNDIVKLVLG